jgi:hypothetical protein
MPASAQQETAGTTTLNFRLGSGPAAEAIRKLPFGEISWLMSGNESIAEVLG